MTERFVMVSHPPMFARQAEDQSKWDEGFKAGVKEVLHDLESSLDVNDPEGPTRKWVEEKAAKLTSKYL